MLNIMFKLHLLITIFFIIYFVAEQLLSFCFPEIKVAFVKIAMKNDDLATLTTVEDVLTKN